jgi:hypothetical protein
MTKVNTGGKGSGRRKSLVPDSHVQDEWRRIFGKKNVPLGPPPASEAAKEKEECQIVRCTLHDSALFEHAEVTLRVKKVSKSDITKRTLRIHTCDGEIDLVISKAAKIKVPKRFLELSENEDGTFRLLFSESLISDFSKVSSIEMVREGDSE